MKKYTEFINKQVEEYKTYNRLTRADGGADIKMKHTNIQDGKADMPQEKSSLQTTDDEAKAVQKTPNRVALADIEAAIESIEYIQSKVLPHLTIAVIHLSNGWAEVGHSAPADAGNFDPELGKKFAREAAMRKLWPLFGFALRENLTQLGKGPRSSEGSQT
jgi:Phage protein (N4 Gp49/phage Sf6 gene 66) family